MQFDKNLKEVLSLLIHCKSIVLFKIRKYNSSSNRLRVLMQKTNDLIGHNYHIWSTQGITLFSSVDAVMTYNTMSVPRPLYTTVHILAT